MPGKETTACQEATEAAVDIFKEALDKMDTTDLEASQEKLDTVVGHQEEPKEEAAVETIRALEGRYGDRHLAVGRCQQPENGPRAIVGP
jgi:hypothetical protein